MFIVPNNRLAVHDSHVDSYYLDLFAGQDYDSSHLIYDPRELDELFNDSHIHSSSDLHCEHVQCFYDWLIDQPLPF